MRLIILCRVNILIEIFCFLQGIRRNFTIEEVECGKPYTECP